MIYQHTRLHEMCAESDERLCARALLRGDIDGARWWAEQAAYERHLVSELNDTANLRSAAMKEYVDEQIAAREADRGLD